MSDVDRWIDAAEVAWELDASDYFKTPDPMRFAIRAFLSSAREDGYRLVKVPDGWAEPAARNLPYNSGRRRGWKDHRTETLATEVEIGNE